MNVSVSVPERENGVAVAIIGNISVAPTFHERILSVYVGEDVGVDEGMVKSGVEHFALIGGATGDADSAELRVPFVSCVLANLVEC